tara:strand:- start:8355 stop:9545 length:1191 start_codon:yes stop_codon:yes gene_type:complete
LQSNSSSLKNYILVTGAYWVFTLSDGALRMLVLLHFYTLGYNALQIALLFLFYELAGIITNLVGGWIGSRFGLKLTLIVGLCLQVFALSALAGFDPSWPVWQAVSFVMTMQALSGVAKDLTKMSSKSLVKLVVADGQQSKLFKWVAILTGSKNALKGLGFFLGGGLLSWVGYTSALYLMASSIAVSLIFVLITENMGKTAKKIKFSGVFSKKERINILSGARFFLFGARDIWFVVGLPLFLSIKLDWAHSEIGFYMACWIIGYGSIQSLAPKFVEGNAETSRMWLIILMIITLLITLSLYWDFYSVNFVLVGLIFFGIAFAVNSSIHSYLILDYSDRDKIAMNVGFYYMSNAGGRFFGTLFSGLLFQLGGITYCMIGSLIFLALSYIISLALNKNI